MATYRFTDCEGSGCPTHLMNTMHLCSMCGNDVGVDEFGVACEHERVDLLRMLDEGAFD